MDLVIINKKKEAVTTSRILAEKFNKRHDNVVAKIEAKKKDNISIFNALKIKAVKYVDEKGESRKEYILNRDAYTFFAMSFTGKKADQFKLDYITAFNDMESWIIERLQNSVEYRVMSAILKNTRELEGKQTQDFHYANEAKLVNWAISGEYKPLARSALSLDEIKLLNKLHSRNAVLIGAGMCRDDRKESLKILVELVNNQLPEVA